MKRQHPIVILTGFFSELKTLLLPIVLGFFFQSSAQEGLAFSRGYLIFMGGMLSIVLISGLLRWAFFRYQYKEGALHVKSGVLIKKRRYIKKERIQTINTEAGVILRLFSLVSLRIETAGKSDEAEFHIKALSKDKAQYLSEQLKDNGLKEELTKDYPTHRLSLQALLLAGITSGGVGLVFGLLGVVLSQGFAFIPEETMDLIINSVIATSIIGIVFTVIIVFFISWVLSTIRYIMRYAFFTLTLEDDQLHITRGLIVQKAFSLKIHRIQAVRIDEGTLRQPFNLASIDVVVAGGTGYESSFKVDLAPLIHTRDIEGFFKKFLPELTLPKTYTPLPKRALRRYLIRSNAPLLLIVPALYFSTQYAFGFLFALPLSILGYMRYKDGGVHYNQDNLTIRSRMLARTTSLTKKRHIQSLQLNKSLFQRWRHLGTLNTHILSAPSKETFTLKDLDESEINTLYTWFGTQKTIQ